MVTRLAGRPAGTSGDDIDGSLVGIGAGAFLEVGAGVTGLAAAGILDHRRRQAAGETKVSVHQEGAFVVMAVAAEDEIHAVAFDDGHDVLSHGELPGSK